MEGLYHSVTEVEFLNGGGNEAAPCAKLTVSLFDPKLSGSSEAVGSYTARAVQDVRQGSMWHGLGEHKGQVFHYHEGV